MSTDRDTLARILFEAWAARHHDWHYAADAVLAHLTTTHPPTDTGLRERIARETHAEFCGCPSDPHPRYLALADRVAAPDPGPDQADGGHLWTCGCLRNESGAHRVGCPDHPEGVNPWAPAPGPDQADGGTA